MKKYFIFSDVHSFYDELMNALKEKVVFKMELENITYKEFINNIINSRGQWNTKLKNNEFGCDRHHIIPKCIGGLPLKLDWSHHENIIWLTHYEHLVAHYLLARENLENYKICLGYIHLLKKEKYKNLLEINEEEYNQIYHNAQKRNGDTNGMFGKTHTKEAIQNMVLHHDWSIYKSDEFRKQASKRSKKSRWWTNIDGSKEAFTEICPEGWHKGRKNGTNQGGKNAAAKPVAVYSLDKELLGEYQTVKEAGLAFGINWLKGNVYGFEKPYKNYYFVYIKGVI